MKTFQAVRQNLVKIHVSADQRWSDNQLLFHICECIFAIILQCIYLFCVANTPEELMNSIFMTTAAILVFISYLSILLKIAEIFFFMDTIEKIVNKSELTN